MKTTIGLNSVVYKQINVPDVLNEISGKVYIGQRPFNSDKDDIVIGNLGADTEQLQHSVAIITLFVKDIQVDNNYYPNLGLLDKVAEKIKPLVDEVYVKSEKTYLYVSDIRDYKIQVENAHEWAIVIRVQTRNINK